MDVERGLLVFGAGVPHGEGDPGGVASGYIEAGAFEYGADAQKEKARSRRTRLDCGL